MQAVRLAVMLVYTSCFRSGLPMDYTAHGRSPLDTHLEPLSISIYLHLSPPKSSLLIVKTWSPPIRWKLRAFTTDS